VLVTNSPYRLGVLSRGHPIALRGEQLAGFGHGLLHVEIDGWAYFITHLTPHGGAEVGPAGPVGLSMTTTARPPGTLHRTL
jgi:hypothetical protein